MRSRRLYRQPWCPSDLGGSLSLWLDGADQGTFTFDTGISQWRDKGPRGGHANQAAAVRQPTLAAAALNGLPGVRFNASHMIGNLVQPDAALSIFTVGRLANTASNSGRIIGMYAAGGSDNATGAFAVIRTSTTEAVRSFYNAAQRTATNVTYGTPFIYGHVLDAAGISSRLNGGAAVTAAVAPTISTALYVLGTDVASGSSGTSRWADDIYEIIVVAATVDADTRQRIEGYLAWKWLPGVLPTTNPFYAAAP